jgi:membrane carboxypeptidase/penicillin-binding protein PbpC
MGYTRSLVVGVWAGNNDNSAMQKRGGSILAAVPIWSAFMNEALKDRPTEAFARPEDIFVDKPMLKGEYIVNFWSGGQKYPQVHDLLFYLDKNDPLGPVLADPQSDSQFENWEEPTLAWARANIPNFDQEYNKPVPSDAQIRTGDSSLFVDVISPVNGSFIGSQINLVANIKSALNIKKVEVYFNGSLIDQLGGLGGNYYYSRTLRPTNVDIQNILKVVVIDESGKRFEKEIILYK